MKYKSKFITTLFTLTIGILISTIGLSFAWFASSASISTDNDSKGIQGSVLTSYFHDGTGTSDDPFIITRPKHWENLIWLHNNLDGFYNSTSGGRDNGGYYFQVGTSLDSSGTAKVYKYDDNGSVIYESGSAAVDTTLNLACYNSDTKGLVPLGSPQTPWLSQLEGNNITVTGFKVLSKDTYNDNHALEDIGIFGYVAESGKCQNIYFTDFTIETGDGAKNENDAYSGHTSHSDTSLGGGTDYPCVGYLAGHILKASSFENVYVNNCKIDGTGSNTDGQLDTYGYFGLVELVEQGKEFGTGNNYAFTFDSSAVYDYLDQNYDSIKDNPIRARNTEYQGNVSHEIEFDTDSSGQSVAKTPFSNGITYSSSAYNLIGDDPDDYDEGEYSGYNYSLSTLGYAEVDESSKDIDYTVKALSSDGTLSDPSKDTVWMPNTYYSLSTASSSLSSLDASGNYVANNATFNSTTNQWEYYHVDVSDRGKVPYKIEINCSGSTEISDADLTNKPTLDDSYCFALLFVDGVQTATWLRTDEGFTQYETTYDTKRRLWTYYTNIYLNVNFTKTIDLNLYMGTHYIAVVFAYGLNTNCTQVKYGAFGYASSISYNNGGTYTVTQNSFTVDNSTPDNYTYKLKFGLDNLSVYGTGYANYPTTTCFSCSGGTFDENSRLLKINDGCDLTSKTLVGIDDTGTQHALDSNGYKFTWVPETQQYIEGTGDYVLDSSNNVQYVTIQNGGYYYLDDNGVRQFQSTDSSDTSTTKIPIRTDGGWVTDEAAHWNAHINVPRTLKTDESGNPVCKYIADDAILTGSGYSAENIDVVGGGYRFSEDYVTIDGEEDRGTVNAITSSDIGKKFYPTKYGASSVILYLSNVGGTNPNDRMGTIVFTYGWTISNFLGYEFKSMCFKQGGTSYVYFEDVKVEDEDYSSVEGDSSTDRVVTIKLRRQSIQKAAYCALDEDGNILTGYDANGNQVGKDATVPVKSIDRYVLLMGVKNNITWLSVNTRVKTIVFDYVAPAGFGGDFGTVEYRDSGTVEGTIFNFYFLCPEGDKYRVHVSFSSNTYTITIFYLSSTTKEEYINVNLYLYNTDDYQVNVTYMNSASASTPTTVEDICSTGSASISVYSSAMSTWTI